MSDRNRGRSLARPRVRRTQASAGYLAMLFLVVVAVVVFFVFHLHVRFEAVRLGYETNRARATKARLIIEQRELRLELASLKVPERVETEAREKLNMEVPDHTRIVLVGKKRRPAPASGRAL